MAERQKGAAEIDDRLADDPFRSTLDHLLEGGQLLSFDWIYLYLNPAAERQNRRPNAELIGRSMLEAWPGIERTEVFGLFRRAMTDRVATHGEIDFHFPDGHHGWFEVRTNPVPQGIFILSVEITARRRAEGSLQLFRLLMDRSRECIEVVDPQTGRVLDVNEEACRLHGCSRAQYLTLTVFDLNPTLTPEQFAVTRDRLERDGAVFMEALHRSFDGRQFPVELSLSRVSAGREYVVSVYRDISDRKRAEATLRETEDRFRQVVENIHEVFRMTEAPHGKVLYVSPGYERIWGRTCASLYASGEPWPSGVVAEEREQVGAAIRGSAGAEWDLTYRIARPDGSVRWIRDRAFPVKDEHAQVQRVVGVAEDVTEAKKMEQQFLRAQRLEAIGTLSSGIAHDLNNILAPMLMLMPALQPKLTDPNDVELVRLVEQSAQRGASIIRQLLTFSRGVEGERGPVQIRHLLREVVAILRETLPRNIAIEERVPQEIWQINADATQLHQVLLNLCVNARDAMPVGGKLTLEVQNLELFPGDIEIHPQARPGRYVVMIVADTGVGIPAHLRDRIFEPFFTTKPMGKGTGLGLSTVVGIVKSHGGFVNVYSEPPRGCVFRVYLPADVQPRPSERKDPSSPPTGNQELLLVVEDEIAVRQTVAQALQKSGYRVVTAASGQEAIRVFLENQTAIRLVVTDLMMPDMDGFGLIRSLRALHVGLPVIAASGLQDRTRSDELAAMGVSLVLTKPFAIGELLRAIGDRLKPSA